MTLEQVKELAEQKLKEHGLKDWRFEELPYLPKSTFGRVNYRFKFISVSNHLIATGNLAEITETILHEIAHAIAGEEARHGEEWFKVAKQIGCQDFKEYWSQKNSEFWEEKKKKKK